MIFSIGLGLTLNNHFRLNCLLQDHFESGPAPSTCSVLKREIFPFQPPQLWKEERRAKEVLAPTKKNFVSHVLFTFPLPTFRLKVCSFSSPLRLPADGEGQFFIVSLFFRADHLAKAEAPVGSERVGLCRLRYRLLRQRGRRLLLAVPDARGSPRSGTGGSAPLRHLGGQEEPALRRQGGGNAPHRPH